MVTWHHEFPMSDNVFALRWLLDANLVTDGRIRQLLEGRPHFDVRDGVKAYLQKHAGAPIVRHNAGRLILLHLADLDVSLRWKVTAVADVERTLLNAGSDVAIAARHIEDHYDKGQLPFRGTGDDGAQVQFESVVLAARSETAVLASDVARTNLGDVVRYGAGRRFALWFLLASVIAGAIPYSDLLDEGSGWFSVWLFASAVLALVGAWWWIRWPGTVMTPSGIEFRGWRTTRREPWAEVCDVDLDTEVVEQDWPVPDGETEVVHASIRNRKDIARPDRIAVPLRSRSAVAVHDEIVAFASRHGAELEEAPDYKPIRFGAEALMILAGFVTLIVMSVGFGMCRYGDCGPGVVIWALETKIDGAEIQDSIEADLEAEMSTNVIVRCPDRVPLDPDDTFTCFVEDAPGVFAADVHHTSRWSRAYEWTYRAD